MNRRNIITLTAIATLGFALLPGNAPAQQKSLKEQLIGVWTLVSNDNIAPDGNKRQPFGANPKGTLILDASGRYAQVQLNPAVPKFKADNRLGGTSEENAAVVRGTAAQFGRWSVDEASKTIVSHLDGSIFPNATGTDTKRAVTIAGDELRLDNPTPGAGGQGLTVWKRVK
jgi:hypothetical protein